MGRPVSDGGSSSLCFYLCHMRRLISVVITAGCCLNSCSGDRDYRPEAHLTAEKQDMLMNRIIRYIARSPEGAPPPDRFRKEYDDHYAEQLRLHRLDALYEDDDGYFFLVSRIAPSLTEKRVAIGGKAMVNKNMQVEYYEEIFRTWKMEPDTLARRAMFLFDLMVEGEDLRPYYASRSGNTDYIEFPDDRTYFDTRQRIWRSK